MENRKNYNIVFSGLKEGHHKFDFIADEKFFKSFEGSEAESGDVSVEIDLEKRSNYLILNFDIRGTLSVVCDRCLDEFEFPVESRNTVYVKFGHYRDGDDESDEIIYLEHGAYEIEVDQLIYEFSLLALPIQRTHPNNEDGNSTCNEEMLDRIGNYQIFEEVSEDTEDIGEQKSPWDELRKIIDNKD